jgi:hypothetical protein
MIGCKMCVRVYKGRWKHNFLSQQFTTMASTKLTETPIKKAKLLKPDQIPRVILESDSGASENDNNKTVDNEEDCEQLWPDQSLLQ